MQSPETMNRHHSAPPHTVTDSVVMRRRKAQWLVSVMLCLSLVIVVLGIYTSTRTESVSITGYTSGIIDVRPLRAGRCQFYNSGNSYIYENYYATVPCQGLTEACSMKVRSGTCYCCDLYDCANGGYLNSYYEFVGVQSCQDVLSLYVLLWVLTVLNLLGFVTGILTTAVLGSIKDMRSGGVCPDVPRWGGSSLLSFEGGNCSSPTAPLLMEASSQIGHQLYPRASLYISPASAGSSVQQTGSSYTSHTQTNPPPFAPLYNLLPDKTSTFCT
ncbi:transmembrane protein 255B isoform X5 [Triplophysa rosa]|uniref:transmembrane protein 255B isoform X5 n=1 Tax=Triplophysa rosa TaxID=992332 RepID=UPI002545C4B1|nr:transmembrane protein 255B isoform X5 [Triplophysa rosa]